MNQPTTKRQWFKPWGFVFVPISWQGFVACLLLFAFCVVIFVVIDSNSHSASDTLIGVGFIIAPAFGVLYWIARATSRDR